MDRRKALLGIGIVPWAAATARAQPRRVARIAWSSVDSGSSNSPSYAEFIRGMRELGWDDGRNLSIDAWWGEGSAERLRELVPKLVARRPDVVVAQGGLAARALLAAGVELPLVFTFSGDPVVAGIVQSYARPGGNRTGITFFALELVPKRLELMKQALPRMKRVALLSSPLHPGEQKELDAATRTATAMGLAHDYFPVTSAGELEAALERIARAKSDAILAFADALMTGFSERIAAFSVRNRIPAISGWAVFAEKGNLMTYGPVLQDSYHRLATFADRILRGERPGEIPVEFPLTVELVVNRTAARSMGLTIPNEVLARAARVID